MINLKTKKIATMLLLVLFVCCAFFACSGGEPEVPVTYAFGVSAEANGTIGGSAAGNYEAGTKLTVTATPASGYVFDGWYAEAIKVSATASYEFEMPANALTLIAKFALEEVTPPAAPTYAFAVSSGNGGTIGGTAAGSFEAGTAVSLTATAQEHYHFVGWYSGETSVSAEATYSFEMPEAAVTLQARFAIDTVTVTYQIDGVTVENGVFTIDYGTGVAAANVPTLPTRTGYTAQWDKSATAVTEDLIVSGVYSIISYTVTYKADGNVIDTVTVAHGQNVAAADVPVVPAKVGYSQTAPTWDNDGTNVVADRIINAVYVINTYSVTYKANSTGTLTEVATFTVSHGGSVAEVPAIPQKVGHTAVWSANGANITSDTVIVAQYSIIYYTVTYNSDATGTLVEVASFSISHGASVTSVPTVPVKAGHTGEWDKVAQNITEDTVITAVYTITTRTVTFKADGEILDSVTVNYGTDIPEEKIPAIPERTGYTAVPFDADECRNITETKEINTYYVAKIYTVIFYSAEVETVGEEPLYTEAVAYNQRIVSVPSVPNRKDENDYYTKSWNVNTSSVIKGDTVIRPKYSKVKFNFNYSSANVNYGTVSGAINGTKEWGTTLTLYATPKSNSYVFDGWYLDGSDTAFSTETTLEYVMPRQATVLVAKFIRVYTVTFEQSEGSTVDLKEGSSASVSAGGSVTVTLAIDADYDNDLSAVELVRYNQNVVAERIPYASLTEGAYTFENVTLNTRIEVDGVQRDKYQYTFVLSGDYSVAPGFDTTHTVTGLYAWGDTITLGTQIEGSYRLDGWFDAESTLLSSEETFTYVMPKANLSLDGRFTQLYTVQFKADGEVITNGTFTVPHGQTIAAEDVPTVPAKTGYAQIAPVWTAAELAVVSTSVTANAVVNAVYTIDKHTITLSSGDGYTLVAESGSVSPTDYGTDYTFRFTLLNGYRAKTDAIAISVNGEPISFTLNAESFDFTHQITDISVNYLVTVSGLSPDTYTVTHTLENVTAGAGTSGANAAAFGASYTATLAAADNYNLPTSVTVTVGGAALVLDTGYTYNAGTGAITILADYVNGDITITAKGVPDTYSSQIMIDNLEITSDSNTIATYGVACTITLMTKANYSLPATISVKVGGAEQVLGTGYTYDSDTGVITIPADFVTGGITLTAIGVPDTYTVTHTLTNVTASAGASGANAATYGVAYTATLAVADNYTLPTSVTVTVGGTEQVLGTGYTYNAGTGAISILADYVTGDIEITATGVVKTYTVTHTLNDITASEGATGANAATYGVNYTATLVADANYSLPDTITITAGGTALVLDEGYTYTSGVVAITDTFITGDIVITANGVPDTYTVTHTLNNVTAGVGASGANAATYGVAYTATLAATDNYKLPTSITITVGGTALVLDTGYTYNAGTGAISILAASVTGDIEITATGVAKTYTVTHTLNDITASEGATGANAATYGVNYTATLVADANYSLPDTITITAGGTALVKNTGYTYESGLIVITGNSITGDIVITANGVPDTYTVTHTLTNVTASVGASGANAATYDVAYTATLAAADNYKLPTSITVTVGGAALVLDTGYTYNAGTGAITILAASVTGAIEIIVNGVPTYSVTPNFTNIMVESGTTGPNAATYNQEYSLTIQTVGSVGMPNSVTITVDGTELVSGTGYTYESGVITIFAASVTGDIVITAAGVPI